jgi:hypothetical protein
VNPPVSIKPESLEREIDRLGVINCVALPVGLRRFFVAPVPVRDLLFHAKHLFVAAIVAGIRPISHVRSASRPPGVPHRDGENNEPDAGFAETR